MAIGFYMWNIRYHFKIGGKTEGLPPQGFGKFKLF